MKRTNPIGILLMAYGSPGNLDDVEAYYTDIRGGRKPSPDVLAVIRHRYELVGGKTPLTEITQEDSRALQKLLDTAFGKGKWKVYIGMKHWHPYIKDTIQQMYHDGIRRIIALPLAPHYSRISIGGYRHAVEEAVKSIDDSISVSFVDSWHMNPYLLDCICEQITDALTKWKKKPFHIVFTAHSLPEKILEWQDPYYDQLLETSKAIVQKLGLSQWSFAFQSAGSTSDTWLGPDILDEMLRVKREGYSNILVCPIGFVSDHLEILFDIDIEAKEFAEKEGIHMFRVSSRNAHPLFIAALKDIVLQANQGH